MAIKCMAFDMDRTTLNAEGKLSEKNKKALEYAIEKGVHVVIASGRAFSALPEDVLKIKGIKYAITCNGAEVYETNGKCLKTCCLPEESVTKIMGLTKKLPVTWECFINGQAYAPEEYVADPTRYNVPPQVVEYVQRTRRREKDIFSFIIQHKKELNSMDIIVRDLDKKEGIWEFLKKQVPDIYITSSVAQLVEISSLESGKHNGLKFLTEYLGISREETAAFGDADNDVDMLAYAGVGVAVANASKACFEAADMVVAHYNEDGAAEGIYRLLAE